MDEEIREALNNIVVALKSLSEVVEQSIRFQMHEGMGDTFLKQYRGLHYRVLQILPEDAYVREYLTLDANGRASEDQKIMQVRLLSEQLLLYLRGQVRAGRPRPGVGAEGRAGEAGRDLREQILSATRDALRRAMSEVDNDLDEKGSESAEGDRPR